jgi:hypothetical protein
MPPREDGRFDPLLAETRTNWEENNPEMVKELQQKGELEKCLKSAVEQAIIILQQCEVRGLAPDQARELAYENLFLYSSDESDQTE